MSVGRDNKACEEVKSETAKYIDIDTYKENIEGVIADLTVQLEFTLRMAKLFREIENGEQKETDDAH